MSTLDYPTFKEGSSLKTFIDYLHVINQKSAIWVCVNRELHCMGYLEG